MTVAIGESVWYAAIAGDVWPAVVTAVRSPEVLDVEIVISHKDRLALSKVPRRSDLFERGVWHR